MTNEEKRSVFELMSKKFETDEFREYFLDMCEHIPDYIFTIPSSTSLKYHNKTQCKVHGQIHHVYMFFAVLEYRLSLEWNRQKYNTPEIRDAMRCVPAFHDAIKCGMNGSMYTVPQHPALAGQWVIATSVKHDVGDKYKTMIARMCEAHSGEWNTNKEGKEILPKPRNDMEFFIHECDYLSSRRNIDMEVPQTLADALSKLGDDPEDDLPDINDYVLTFGKYKDQKLVDVYKENPGYIAWCKDNIYTEPARTMIKRITERGKDE